MSISIDGNTITVIYFKYLKKFLVSSKITETSISKNNDISYRSSSKKFTLLIKIGKNKFNVNKLDNFDEQELMEF